SPRTSSRERSREVLDRRRIVSNFGRANTSASAARSDGLLMRVSVPLRTRSSSACGVPCQRSPASSTLVSMVARTLLTSTLGARGFDFGVDLFHRHRLDPGGGDAIGDGQERIGGLLAS